MSHAELYKLESLDKGLKILIVSCIRSVMIRVHKLIRKDQKATWCSLGFVMGLGIDEPWGFCLILVVIFTFDNSHSFKAPPFDNLITLIEG